MSTVTSSPPTFARGPVLAAMGTQAVVLLALAPRYGYHRDELYFRMLPPAWGYLDQPPLTPLLVHAATRVLGDTVWALRLPAVLMAVVAVWLVARLTREVGGDRTAQALAAWGYAFAAFPLVFGHSLLTNSLDTVFWLAVMLCVVRALMRDEGRWWLLAGALTGLAFANKLLIVILLASLAAGLLLVGHRRVVVSRPVLAGVGIAALVGLPTIVYQATHGFPQLTFGAALSEHNGGEVRIVMWPMLLLMLGPPLAPVWVAGLVALWRRREWAPVRFLVPAFVVLVIICFAMGSQPTYAFPMVATLFAIGCVPTVDWWRGRAWRPGFVGGLVALNAAISLVIALPVIPVAMLGRTPVPGINQAARDSVGWPTYVRQVADVYAALPPDQRGRAVLFATNYGEAGALERFGPDYALPPVFSGHNQLADEGRPPEGRDIAIVVGAEYDWTRQFFESCRVRGRLDNGVAVANEEQGMPIGVCTGPIGGWAAVWPQLSHMS